MSKLFTTMKFKQLKELSEAIDKKEFGLVIDFLNSYPGEDIFEKFKNILIDWEYHTSDNLNLTIDGKSIKIQLSYIINQLPTHIQDDIFLTSGGFDFVLNIPKKFKSISIVAMEDLIQSVSYNGINLKVGEFSEEEYQTFLNFLPASVFNDFLNLAIKHKEKIITFDNPTLKNIKLDFMTNEPLGFLYGLLGNFSRDYFRQIMFYLSKRVPADIILNSDIKDIEFYIEEYNRETKDQQESANPSLA